MKNLFVVGLLVFLGNVVYANTILNVQAPQITKTADLNNDGKEDIVVGSLNDETFSIYLQNVAGEFIFKKSLNVSQLDEAAFSLSFELGYFNNDKNVDLIIFNDQQKVYLYLGLGDGTFDEGLVQNVAPATDILVSKVNTNDDNFDDLLVAPGHIFYGNLAFELLTTKDSKGYAYSGKRFLFNIVDLLKENELLIDELEIDQIVYADFNGDKRKDLVVVSTSYDFLLVLCANEEGSYSTPYILRTFSGPTTVRALDIDKDGKSELVVGHYKDKRSMIFYHDGQSLRYQQSFDAGKYPTGFYLDYRDGIKSIVSLDYYTGTLKFFNNWKKTYVNSQADNEYQMALRGIHLHACYLNDDKTFDYLISDLRSNAVLEF